MMKMTEIFIFLLIVSINCFKENQYMDFNNFYSQKLRNKRDIIFNNTFAPPKIVIDIPSLVKISSNKNRLNCKAVGHPQPTIKWYVLPYDKHNFQEVVDNDRTVVHLNGDLEFVVEPQKPDVYYCQAINVLGSAFSRKSLVRSLYPSKNLKIIYETLSGYLNEKAVIQCSVKPDVFLQDINLKYWEIKFMNSLKKPTQIFKTDGRFSVITTTKSPQLHIRNLTNTDFNDIRVRCILGNIFAQDDILDTDSWAKLDRQIYTYELDKPFSQKMCQGMDIIRVNKGSTIELPWCSRPFTRIVTWYRSKSQSRVNAEVVNLMGTKYSMLSKTFGNLIIHNIDITEEGYYFGRSSVDTTREHIPFNVRVTVNLGIEISPEAVNARYNESVTLRCVVSGYPISSIKWFYNSASLGSTVILDKESTPTTRVTTKDINVTLETIGVYQCVAESRESANSRILNNAQISVPVMIVAMAPQLVSQSPVVRPGDQYSFSTLVDDMSSIDIECIFNSIPTASIVWYLDENPINIVNALTPTSSPRGPYTMSYQLQIDLSKLQSIGEKWMYGGEYVAELSNHYGKAHCKTLVFVAGVFKIREPSPKMFLHGQKLSLKCQVISAFRPEIQWSLTRNGKTNRLPDSHYQAVSADKREFTIQKLDKNSHEGIYTCRSSLNNNEISMNFTITIAKPPLALSLFPEQIFLSKLSETMKYSCMPRMLPDRPWYAWWEYHPNTVADSKPIVVTIKSNRYTNINGIQAEYQVPSDDMSANQCTELHKGVPPFLQSRCNQPVQIYVTLQNEFHLAKIICVVQNHAGIIRKAMELVLVNIVFEQAPPSHEEVVLGNSLVLNCSVKPNQLKTITNWHYETTQEKPIFVSLNGSTIPNIRQLPNGQLIINHIKLTDPQRFMCVIKSSISTEKISKVVTIEIKVPAKIRPLNGTIDLERFTKTEVTCSVDGDRKNLSVAWYKHDGQIWKEIVSMNDHEGSGNKITNFSFPLQSVVDSDDGLYQCVAKNSFNTQAVMEQVKLNVVATPGGVHIKNESTVIHDRSISLYWQPPTNDGRKPITNYIVTYSTPSDSLNQSTTDTSITLHALRPYQRYAIVVQAVNSVGPGDKSGRIDIVTLQAVPGGPVRTLIIEPVSPTSLRMKWEPPDSLLVNGIIRHYQICYLEIGENQTQLAQLAWPSPNKTIVTFLNPDKKENGKEKCKNVFDSEVLVEHLLKFTNYAFRVIVVNEAGPGPAAFGKARTMEDNPESAPTQVSCTSEGNRLSLEWNPPPHSSINGVLIGYKIVYFRTNHNKEPDSFEDSVSGTKHDLNNLAAATNYTIQVSVVNKKGLGPPSNPVHCATNEAAPSTPGHVKAFFVNNSCALVSWTPPTRRNGVIRKYCVRVLQGIPESAEPVCVRVTENRYYYKTTICDLNYGDDTKVSVTAYTRKEGTPANTSVSRVEHGSARILSFSMDVVTVNLSTVVLDCETVPTNVRRDWLHGDQRYYAVENNGSVILSDLTRDRSGNYTCSVDHDSINYRVSLKSPSLVPSAPSFSFHNVSTDNIFLSWTSGGSSREADPIRSFVIKVSDQDFIREQEVPGTLRTARVVGLDCGRSFRVDLFAKNLAGNSAPAVLLVRTIGTKPIIPKTDQLVSGQMSQSICFNLGQFLPGQGCHATHFQLTLVPTNQGQMSVSRMGEIKVNRTRTSFSDSSCFNVTGLHPDTDYSYRIEASNRNGSIEATGHARTGLLLQVVTPSVTMDHTKSTNGLHHATWIVVAVLICVFIAIFLSVFWYVVRRFNTSRQQQRTMTLNNHSCKKAPLPQNIQSTPAILRNRKLPTPPNNNVYDKGNTDLPKSDDDDDDEQMKPYATYESTPKIDPMTSRDITGRQPPSYNTGSQAHSYQYPNILDNQQHLLPVNPSLKKKVITYENDLKQPLLKQTLNVFHRPYDQGYARGQSLPTSSIRPPILHADPHPNLDRKGIVLPIVSESESYRAGSSLCSSNTESSTKEELSQVFRNPFGNQFASRLQEQDEDRASTAMGNRSTLMNRPRHLNHTLSDDSTQPESYCESGSSGDDCGIMNFTQEPPGQQVIAPTSIRQCHARSSIALSYDTADRSQIIPHSTNFTHPQHRNPLPEEDEEEDSNNYTNNFVVV